MALEQQIQQLSDMVLQLQQMLASAVGELAKSLEKKEDRRKSQILMDTKGLGRPESCGNVEGEFRKWARSIDNLFITTFGREFIEVLEYILEQEDAIEMSAMESAFGTGTTAAIDDLEDKAGQIHRVLLTLTSGETEDLMVGASNGFEAYRNILRAILQPERVKTWTAVRPAIEQLEELIRRYEARRNASGARETLSDDIKSASLEMLVPPDLEKHLLLNKSRLTSYSLIKPEIELVIESSLTSKSSVPKPGSSSSSYQGPQPMDVDSIGQWIASLVKGKGKGKGKQAKGDGKKGSSKGGSSKGSNPAQDITCYNCGKKGHRTADCWSKKRPDGKGDKWSGSGKGDRSGKGGKGSKGKGGKGGKGKAAGSMEEMDDPDDGIEPAPEADVGMLMADLSGVGIADTSSAEEWMKFNLDTGAAQTAIPNGWEDRVVVSEGNEVVFTTASGELVPSQGIGTFEGFDESGNKCRVKGSMADVHKPLISASKCLGFGRIAVLDVNGGSLIPQGSKVGKAVQAILEKASAAEQRNWIPVYQEQGVYNFYLGKPGYKPTKECCGIAELNATGERRDASMVSGRPGPERQEEDDELELVDEVEKPIQIRAPEDPTPAEIEEHEATGHVQYRNWCRHCIAGRAVGQPHRTRSEEQKAKSLVPTVAMDSRGGVEDERVKPILVVKDERTQSLAATFVDSKGATPYAVKFAANFLKNLGHRKVVLKSDGEPSVVALKEAAAKETGIDWISEESPVGDHQANGLAENACKEVKRQVRVLRSALEEKLSKELKDDDPALAWLPRQAGDLLSRYKKGQDGRTPETRRCGKQWRKPAIAFGERLYFREVGEGVRILKEGRYVGHHGRTGSILVMMADGVRRGTGIRRLSSADRWDPSGWDLLRGLPWEHSAARPAGEQLMLEERLVVPLLKRNEWHHHSRGECTSGERMCTSMGPQKAAQDASASWKTRGRPCHTQRRAEQSRITEAMEKDEAGQARLEAHAKKRKERQQLDTVKPKVVSDKDTDIAAEDAAGEPEKKEEAKSAGSGSPPPTAAEGEKTYPDDPKERYEMKRQAAEMEKKPVAKAKVATEPKKRTGELRIDPPGAKVKPNPAQGTKRTAETAVEDLDPRVEESPKKTGTFSHVPETPPAGWKPDAASLAKEKEIAKQHLKKIIQGTYEANGIEITEQEIGDIAHLSMQMSAVDILEIYSPKRFTALAERYKLRPGFAVDLNEMKKDGTYWDLNKSEDVQEVHDILERDEPALLTGSPPCHMFSQLQNLNWRNMAPDVRKKKMDEAVHHLHTSVELYVKQHRSGRKFLHEAPWAATNWKDEKVEALANEDGVFVVKGPMCRWQMMATDRRGLQGTGYVRKETGWMTNDAGLARVLQGVCSNESGKGPWHRHIHLIGGIARQAAVYPPQLVKAVLRSLRDTLAEKGELNTFDLFAAGPGPEIPLLDPEFEEVYMDDVNGGILPAEKVKEARRLEMDYLKEKHGVYVTRPRAECFEETGKPPIPVRWLDTNKGDPTNPNYRSRLVVREIKARKTKEEQLPANLLFSSTPPLEAMRLLCSLWATKRKSCHNQPLKLGLWDISRAQFYGTPKRKIYIELPPEDEASKDGQTCGLLVVRDTGRSKYLADALYQKAGFRRGLSNASVFYQEACDVRVMVHGDDFLALGDAQHLEKLSQVLKDAYELKCLGILGDEDGDRTEAHFLNRLIRVEKKNGKGSIVIEADRRHVDLLIQAFGLGKANGVESPDVKKSADQQMLESRSPLLDKSEASKYRSATMRAAYLSQDRLDIGHAVKNLARGMVSPTEAKLADLKRLIRYLKKYPDVGQCFGSQQVPSKLRVQVDADHGGDAVTRKSTTGMVAIYGTHVLKHSSNIQSTIALSTGEREYFALVKGGSVGLGLQSLCADLGLDLEVTIEGDSNAAKGTVNRVGLGKARHIQTRYLWLQERIAEGHLKAHHVPGVKNKADVLTKSVPGVQLRKTMEDLQYAFLSKRSKGQLDVLE